MSLEIPAAILGWILYFVSSSFFLIWFAVWYREDGDFTYSFIPLFLFSVIQLITFIILNLEYHWVVLR